MSDPVLDLQAALLAYLRAQPSLGAWLGDPARVYDARPAEAAYPYLAFSRVEAQAIGGIGPEVTEQTLSLIAVSRFDGTEEAKAIAGELRVLLDQAELSLTGNHLVSLRVVFVDVFRAADQRTVYAVVRLRAVSESLS
ncbi:MAG: DUF3168 domain-containing protein [Asticcacaulis sp.]